MFGQHLFATILLISFIGLISGQPPNCDHSGVTAMKHIYHCCKHPDAHNEITEKCSAATGFHLPNFDAEVSMEITPELVAKASCFSECVFNSSKFINNGAIDINFIRKSIENDHAQDPEYIREILAAFDQCHSTTEEKKAAIMNSGFMSQHLKDRCDPMPGVILSCAILKFFKNCPAGRWTDNQQCNDARSYLTACEKKFG